MVTKTVFLLCALSGLSALGVGSRGQSSFESASQRAAERLKILRREADELSTRGKSLLGELRQLDIERQLKAEALAAIDLELQRTRAQLADAAAKTSMLDENANTERPEVEARLVRLYKMGRAGYWRLLLDGQDVQAMGRAYRTAAALSRLDGERLRNHQGTVLELARQREALNARTKQIAALQREAIAARAVLDRAVAERSALVTSIEARRELAAQLANELQAAQQKLQGLGADPGNRSGAVALPLRPFRGDLPWPADGIVLRRFGRQRTGGGLEVTRNGIEISLAEGRPVSAVHDGVVSFAAPFTGYANVVIVDHGEGAQTLYGHLAALAVNKGGRVAAGTNVGLAGRNPGGNPALYFELRVDGKPVDPLQWLKRQQP